MKTMSCSQAGMRWRRQRCQFACISSLILVAAGLSFTAPVNAGDGRIDATNGDTYFSVHFRFPPTPQQLAEVRSSIDLMAFGVCDATDSQLRVRKATLTQGQANEDKADFWLHSLPGRSGVSFFFNGSNLGRLGRHVDMFSGALLAPDVYLHEFGHHAWGLGDEYDEQARFGGPCGIGPGFDAGSIDEQNHSIMQQSGNARCVGGASAGTSCFSSAQCGAGGSCQLVLMTELSVASNNDPLQGNGNNCPAVAAPATACPDNAYCQRVWNSTTNRYERTQQSEIHNGDSDWETLVQNYPFLTAPAGLPTAAAPPGCFRAVQYQEDVAGSDQVLLLLDKSGSMSWSSNPADAEVCGNGVDDDADGAVDEATCGDARVTFVRAAASAYLDLQRDLGIDVGILTFDSSATLNRKIEPLGAGNIAAYRSVINSIVPGGNTGIGDALEASKAEFARVAALGRSRTAYLMTDGDNTSGSDPVQKANELRDIGVRVHVIPAGLDVSLDTLSGVAAATSGDLLQAAALNDLTAIYAELAGRHRGAAMVLPRVNFEVSLRGDGDHSGMAPVRERAFPIDVEKGAKTLVAFVGGRNNRMAEWSVGLKLTGPNGEVFAPGSPQLTATPHYVFVNVPNPSAGRWWLRVAPTGAAVQKGTALAFVDNPDPDFFVDAKPQRLSATDPVQISASPSYVARLDGKGVTIKGQVEGPGGFTAPLSVTQNASGAWSATAGPFPYDGYYRATLELDVDASATLAPGESIFAGPAVPAVSPVPFRRFASAGFVVRTGRDAACPSRNSRDCDEDGVPDRSECRGFHQDIDKDGRPNWNDPDSDGDEIPDAVEKGLDLNRNRVPDMCEPGEPRTAPPPKGNGNHCLALRLASLQLMQAGPSWQIGDGRAALLSFGDDRRDAENALAAIRRYRATELCYVGVQGRSMSYLLSNGAAPRGAVSGERCLAVDSANLRLEGEGSRVVLYSGPHPLRQFDSRAEADAARVTIRSYGFTNYCRIGPDESGLEYLRR